MPDAEGRRATLDFCRRVADDQGGDGLAAINGLTARHEPDKVSPPGPWPRSKSSGSHAGNLTRRERTPLSKSHTRIKRASARRSRHGRASPGSGIGACSGLVQPRDRRVESFIKTLRVACQTLRLVVAGVSDAEH